MVNLSKAVLICALSFAVPVGAVGLLDPVCEARVIAEYVPRITRAEWMAIVDEAEMVGQIDAAHAVALRALINDAYVVADLPQWAERNCK